jgi:hypothetical protein
MSSGILRYVALKRTDVSEERTLRRNTKLVFLRSVRRLLVAACVVPSSPIFVNLMKEAPGSSETSVITRVARRNNPEDTILHMVFVRSVLLLLVTTNVVPSSPNSCHPDDGGVTFLRNVDTYRSPTA